MIEYVEPFYVTSSNIDCVGYLNARLYIRFKSGVTYSYKDVTYDCFDALRKAESVGQYFHRFIRKNDKIRFRKEPGDPFVRIAA